MDSGGIAKFNLNGEVNKVEFRSFCLYSLRRGREALLLHVHYSAVNEVHDIYYNVILRKFIYRPSSFYIVVLNVNIRI